MQSGDVNVEHQDLLMAQGKWDNEEDEASYRRWLDSIEVEEMYTEAQLEKMEREWNRL